MLLSVSRRTDIPNWFSEWFFHRLQDGFVLVRNPFAVHRVSRIPLSPDIVDGIVFWTKNPLPMLKHLSGLAGYPCCFQFTLNPYGTELEPGVPPPEESVKTFRRLSERIGPERVLWRYDPVLIGGRFDVPFHRAAFDRLARLLRGYTRRCTFSFLDCYRRMPKKPEMHPPSAGEMRVLAASFAGSAGACGMKLMTCCEKIDLSGYGITHAACVDGKLMEAMAGCRLSVEKDPGQRSGCGCVSSIDIGTYGTCQNGCRYCYATQGRPLPLSLHDPKSPLLFGSLGKGDIVTERKVRSCREEQIRFY